MMVDSAPIVVKMKFKNGAIMIFSLFFFSSSCSSRSKSFLWSCYFQVCSNVESLSFFSQLSRILEDHHQHQGKWGHGWGCRDTFGRQEVHVSHLPWPIQTSGISLTTIMLRLRMLRKPLRVHLHTPEVLKMWNLRTVIQFPYKIQHTLVELFGA